MKYLIITLITYLFSNALMALPTNRGAFDYDQHIEKLINKSINLNILSRNGKRVHQTTFPYASNCWNSTMFTLGITNVPYVSGYNEIRSLLSSPLCKIIKKGEKLQWGDVMAFRQILPFAPDESGKFTKHILDDRHTSIYLDAKTTYSQNGIDPL